MKVLKGLMLVLGLIGLGVGGYFLFQAWLEVRNLWAIANSMRSTTSVNPTPTVLIAALVGMAGGLLLGIGIGLPSRTRGAIRRQALQDASDMREASIRQRVGGTDADGREVDVRDGDRRDDVRDRRDDARDRTDKNEDLR